MKNFNTFVNDLKEEENTESFTQEETGMKVIYPKDENGNWSKVSDLEGFSVFLAGPCPRNNYESDWRNEAFDIFRDLGFEGTVISPTNDKYDENNRDELEVQTEWEHKMMEAANLIFFNLDKDDEHPGFTTNYECGEWFSNKSKQKLVYCPRENTKRANRYIIIKAKQNSIKVVDTNLREAIKEIQWA